MRDQPVALPESVIVVFPRDVGGVYTITKTIASLAITEIGNVVGFDGSKTFHSTAMALGSGTPTNDTELQLLATQIARDYYLWELATPAVTFTGVTPWEMSGYESSVTIDSTETILTRVDREGGGVAEREDLFHHGTVGGAENPAECCALHITYETVVYENNTFNSENNTYNYTTEIIIYNDSDITYNGGEWTWDTVVIIYDTTDVDITDGTWTWTTVDVDISQGTWDWSSTTIEVTNGSFDFTTVNVTITGGTWDWVGATIVYDSTTSITYESGITIIYEDPLDETNGGTGIDDYTLGDIIYADAADSLTTLAGNTTTTKKYLSQTGNGTISAAPVWDSAPTPTLANHQDQLLSSTQVTSATELASVTVSNTGTYLIVYGFSFQNVSGSVPSIIDVELLVNGSAVNGAGGSETVDPNHHQEANVSNNLIYSVSSGQVVKVQATRSLTNDVDALQGTLSVVQIG